MGVRLRHPLLCIMYVHVSGGGNGGVRRRALAAAFEDIKVKGRHLCSLSEWRRQRRRPDYRSCTNEAAVSWRLATPPPPPPSPSLQPRAAIAVALRSVYTLDNFLFLLLFSLPARPARASGTGGGALCAPLQCTAKRYVRGLQKGR